MPRVLCHTPDGLTLTAAVVSRTFHGRLVEQFVASVGTYIDSVIEPAPNEVLALFGESLDAGGGKAKQSTFRLMGGAVRQVGRGARKRTHYMLVHGTTATIRPELAWHGVCTWFSSWSDFPLSRGVCRRRLHHATDGPSNPEIQQPIHLHAHPRSRDLLRSRCLQQRQADRHRACRSAHRSDPPSGGSRRYLHRGSRRHGFARDLSYGARWRVRVQWEQLPFLELAPIVRAARRSFIHRIPCLFASSRVATEAASMDRRRRNRLRRIRHTNGTQKQNER